MLKAVLSRLFNVYVACNMLLCSVLFFWAALPRETISGLMGRKTLDSRGAWFWWIGWMVVDAIYFWEPHHCFMVAIEEGGMRGHLYPDLHHKSAVCYCKQCQGQRHIDEINQRGAFDL